MIRVGQRLKEERVRQGFSLEDVAKATKIRLSFLKSIEDGTYSSLPSVTYVQGFVKNYIDFLGLPPKELFAVFRREFNEKEHVGILPENLASKKEISLNKIRVRQAIILGVCILAALVVYIFIQYRAAFFSPSLTIFSPPEHAIVRTQTITVTGQTEQNTSVSVNAIPVFVDNSGSFKKEIPVFVGNSTVIISSTNAFGKTTTIQRHILVKGN